MNFINATSNSDTSANLNKTDVSNACSASEENSNGQNSTNAEPNLLEKAICDMIEDKFHPNSTKNSFTTSLEKILDPKNFVNLNSTDYFNSKGLKLVPIEHNQNAEKGKI